MHLNLKISDRVVAPIKSSAKLRVDMRVHAGVHLQRAKYPIVYGYLAYRIPSTYVLRDQATSIKVQAHRHVARWVYLVWPDFAGK